DPEGRWSETVPGARADLPRIVAGLVAAAEGSQRALAAAFAAARERHPEVTAETGRAIFTALGCAGCHRHAEIEPIGDRAPSLAEEGARVRRDWLVAYLAAPEPLRPLGTPPGSGSRMPDFHLDETEVAALAELLDGADVASAAVADVPA